MAKTLERAKLKNTEQTNIEGSLTQKEKDNNRAYGPIYPL